MSKPFRSATVKIQATAKPPASQRAKPHQLSLIHFVYEPFPSPLNCTTLQTTRDIAADKAHPFHIRTRRRLAAFDRNKLHWRVHCPVDVSKKSFIRDWATRRVKWALQRELKGGGHEGDGQTPTQAIERSADGTKPTLDGLHGEKQALKYGELKGAMLLILAKDKMTLTASNEEVEKSVRGVLDQVLARFRAAHRRR